MSTVRGLRASGRLSIAEAVRDAGRAPALLEGDEVLDFAALGGLARAIAERVRAARSGVEAEGRPRARDGLTVWDGGASVDLGSDRGERAGLAARDDGAAAEVEVRPGARAGLAACDDGVSDDLGSDRGERAGLAALGPVGLVAHRSRATIASVLALLELGAPIVVLHPRAPATEHDRLLARAGARLVLEQGGVRAVPPARGPALRPDTAAVFFTSGTTGQPKGAELSAGALVAAAEAMAQHLGVEASDRWLLTLPPAHVGGFSIIVRALCARRPIVLPAAEGFSEDALVEAVAGQGATLVSLVPTMLARLLRRGWRPPPYLRAVLLGGAPASPTLLAGASRAELPVLTTYGLTEASAAVTVAPPGSRPDPEIGAGVPLPGVSVRVRGGEIEVAGRTLMSGYLGVPAAETFCPQGPSSPRWFATGDLGRIDPAGRLHVLGRRTTMIIRGGENVYPAEVEAVLESSPGVLLACVFGLPDEEWGEIVCAALMLAPGVDVRAVEAHARGHLAPHQRPRRIWTFDQLPLGPAGKVDRRAVIAAVRASPPLCPPG